MIILRLIKSQLSLQVRIWPAIYKEEQIKHYQVILLEFKMTMLLLIHFETNSMRKVITIIWNWMKGRTQYNLFKKQEIKDSNKFNKYVMNLLLREIKPFKIGAEEFKKPTDAIESIFKLWSKLKIKKYTKLIHRQTKSQRLTKINIEANILH